MIKILKKDSTHSHKITLTFMNLYLKIKLIKFYQLKILKMKQVFKIFFMTMDFSMLLV